MKNYLKARFAILCIFGCLLITGCSALSEAIAENKEVCDSDGDVFVALSTNYGEWTEYFEDLSLSSDNGITINLGNDLYVVRSLYQTPEGLPILSIITWDTYPVTFLGNAGYLYVPDDDLSFFPTEFQTEQMSPNIYCYFDPDARGND
ncbi:MAG: hypothetical protein ACFE0Q_01105 [Anaerolineae bacterium]